MSGPAGQRRWRLALMDAIRLTPLPWTLKWRLLWLGGTKVLLSAVAVIRDPDGRVLILRSRYSGRWQLAGGGVLRRETVEQAVRRECREELGLSLLDARLVAVVPDRTGLTQCAVFACGLAEGRICLSEEHTTYRYATREELPAGLGHIVRLCEKSG